MTRRIQKIGANNPCPCVSGRKYKVCCRDTVDWETLSTEPDSVIVRYLSTRGKNKLFLHLVLAALQIDSEELPIEFPTFKRAFTSEAVRKIYEALEFVWPDGEDLKRVLVTEARQTSGLYIGRYEPDPVARGITRHILYADRILLVDPLIYPQRVRDELNPMLHPEQHRTTTLKWITLWHSLAPWIEAGLVGFVRAPGDFYPMLARDAFFRTKERFDKHPEFDELRKADVDDLRSSEDHEEHLEHMRLMASDGWYRKLARETKPDATDEEIEDLIQYLRRKRDNHPYYLDVEEGKSRNEIIQLSTGTNYEQAKMIAHHSGSYVVTDLRSRWREIELDRADAGADSREWSALAKAFQHVPFKFLNSVPLEAALALRESGRLEAMRSFLRKTWNATAKGSPFDETNATNLAAELEEKVREAEVEWRKIDRELLQILTAEAVAGLTAAGPLVAGGQAHWLAAVAAVAGVGTLVSGRMKKAEHRVQYPAGFFSELKRGDYSA